MGMSVSPCVAEIRPPPTQRPVSWELECCPQKITVDTQHHPSAGYRRLIRLFSVNSNCFFCSDNVSRAGLTTTGVLQRPLGLRTSVLQSDTEGQACNSWPPPFILITSYQRRAANSHSASSHIPTQLSKLLPPPPRFALIYALLRLFSSFSLGPQMQNDNMRHQAVF